VSLALGESSPGERQPSRAPRAQRPARSTPALDPRPGAHPERTLPAAHPRAGLRSSVFTWHPKDHYAQRRVGDPVSMAMAAAPAALPWTGCRPPAREGHGPLSAPRLLNTETQTTVQPRLAW